MNENLKAVWKYYLLFFIGVALLWLGRRVNQGAAGPEWIPRAFFTAGAIFMFAGAVLVMLWNVKQSKAARTDPPDRSRKK